MLGGHEFHFESGFPNSTGSEHRYQVLKRRRVPTWLLSAGSAASSRAVPHVCWNMDDVLSEKSCIYRRKFHKTWVFPPRPPPLEVSSSALRLDLRENDMLDILLQVLWKSSVNRGITKMFCSGTLLSCKSLCWPHYFLWSNKSPRRESPSSPGKRTINANGIQAFLFSWFGMPSKKFFFALCSSYLI